MPGAAQGAFEMDGKPVPAWGALYVATMNMADAALDQVSHNHCADADHVCGEHLEDGPMLHISRCGCADCRWMRQR
jgi:hypothetical protein